MCLPPKTGSCFCTNSFYFQIEGSVNEESTKSDEEYDDLAVQHVQENGYKKNGYLSGDDESSDELMSACERWQQPTGEMLSRKKVC